MLFVKEVITVYFDNNTKHTKYNMWAKRRFFLFNFKSHGACIYMPLFFERMNVFGSHIRLNNSARTVVIETYKYVA
jgi:hypothetical protein